MIGGVNEDDRWARLVAPMIRYWATAIGCNTPRQLQQRSLDLIGKDEAVSDKTWKRVLDTDEPIQAARWAAMSASLGWHRSVIGAFMRGPDDSPLAVLDPGAARMLKEHQAEIEDLRGLTEPLRPRHQETQGVEGSGDSDREGAWTEAVDALEEVRRRPGNASPGSA